MPSLSKARGQAQSLVCKANMKTIGQAEQLFAMENGGKLAWTRGDQPGNSGFYWAAQLWAKFYAQSIPKGNEITRIIETQPKWLSCPAQKKFGWGDTWPDVRLDNGKWWLNNICYSRNLEYQGWLQYANGVFTESIPQGRIEKLPSPSRLLANADGGHYMYFWGDRIYTDKYLWDGTINPPFDIFGRGGGYRVTEYRHQGNQGLNVLLWDGHVESVTKSIADHFMLK